jgi:enterochelin esterase-like enzyme
MADLGEVLSALESAGDEEAHLLVGQLLRHPELGQAQGADAHRAARAISVYGPPQQLNIAGQLAARAHQQGIPGAGVLFAECADKVSLMSGRPQRYGTVTMQHQGDMVLAPLDGAADDTDRAAVGLPPLQILRDNVDRQNMALARERAAADSLPRGQRFCRVWTDPSAEQIRAGLDAHPEGAWADGEVLTLACRSDAVGILPGPVFELPMWRVPEADGSPSGLFAVQIRVERLAEAVFGYGFWELGENGMPVSGGRGPVDHRFRGPDAPAELPSHADDALHGTLETHSFASSALRENRPVKVYLPPGHTPEETLPVVYSTDGNMFGPYARRLDAGIVSGAVPRVVVVAPHAAPMDHTGNERALEYLPGFDDQRFDRHQRFFVQELSEWAEGEFGVSSRREDRAVFGCSDGGGHALATGHMHRERYGHCIAYSTGMPPNEQLRWDPETAPFVHLCAGTLETGFHQATEAWAAWLHFHKSPHDWTERVCGHDLIQWIEELPRAVTRAWGEPPG